MLPRPGHRYRGLDKKLHQPLITDRLVPAHLRLRAIKQRGTNCPASVAVNLYGPQVAQKQQMVGDIVDQLIKGPKDVRRRVMALGDLALTCQRGSSKWEAEQSSTKSRLKIAVKVLKRVKLILECDCKLAAGPSVAALNAQPRLVRSGTGRIAAVRVEDDQILATDERRGVGEMVGAVETEAKAPSGGQLLQLATLTNPTQSAIIRLREQGVVINQQRRPLQRCHLLTEQRLAAVRVFIQHDLDYCGTGIISVLNELRVYRISFRIQV